jgi:hypothetical protein
MNSSFPPRKALQEYRFLNKNKAKIRWNENKYVNIKR